MKCPTDFPLILWHPYARHYYFCVMTGKEQEKWGAVFQDCVRHCNNGELGAGRGGGRLQTGCWGPCSGPFLALRGRFGVKRGNWLGAGECLTPGEGGSGGLRPPGTAPCPRGAQRLYQR